MTTDFPYYYAWKNNPKRPLPFPPPNERERQWLTWNLYAHLGEVAEPEGVARGALNSVLIEFENGQREVVSRNAVRKRQPAAS